MILLNNKQIAILLQYIIDTTIISHFSRNYVFQIIF